MDVGLTQTVFVALQPPDGTLQLRMPTDEANTAVSQTNEVFHSFQGPARLVAVTAG